MLFLPTRVVGDLQRVLIVAMLTPVVLIAVIATIPALVLLPFFPQGTDRAVKLFTAYTTYVRVLLNKSRSNSDSRPVLSVATAENQSTFPPAD